MILAASAVSSLVAVTWALTRLSAWVSTEDIVRGQMNRRGADVESWIADLFLGAQTVYLPVIEAVTGVVFLFLLWRTLYAKQKGSESHDAA